METRCDKGRAYSYPKNGKGMNDIGGIVNAFYCPWNIVERRSVARAKPGYAKALLTRIPDLEGIISLRISDIITLRTD